MREQVEFAAELFRKLAALNQRDAESFEDNRDWLEGRVSAYTLCAEHLDALLNEVTYELD